MAVVWVVYVVIRDSRQILFIVIKQKIYFVCHPEIEIFNYHHSMNTCMLGEEGIGVLDPALDGAVVLFLFVLGLSSASL